MTRILALTLALLSFAGQAFAQKDLARERVSLQFKDTPIAQIFPALAKSLGYELTLDSQLHALITLQVENVTAQTALNAICESAGCRWRLADKRLIVEARTDVLMTIDDRGKRPPGISGRSGSGAFFAFNVHSLDEILPVDITWSPVSLGLAFAILAENMNAGVDLAPSLTGRKIAVSIRNASMRQAFNAICEVGSCRWEFVEKPKRIVRVTERRGPEGDASRVYEKTDPGITPPRVITQARPRYTRETMQARKQGTVRLSCVVERDGSVSDVQVIQSLDPSLDEEAVETMYRWRFAPGTLNGQPVPVRVETEFTFTLT